jgi:hypothetical protein
MSVEQFALPEVPGIAANLFADRWVVAITALTDDSEWATAAAWSVARAAAATGRRTALIDLYLDDPRLHTHAIRPLDTGIVDAFLFGASLQHVASQDENQNLHFIGVGTPTANAREVLENERWERLSRGFRKEEAVLFLFMPASGLDSLSLCPDLIIALSPRGLDAAGPRDPSLRSAIDRGFTLAVVTDPDVQDDGSGVAQDEALDSSKDKQRKVLLPLSVAVVTILVVGAILLTSGRETTQSTPHAQGGNNAAAAPQNYESSPRDEQDLPVVPTPSGPVDTLAFSIQVAAWARLNEAFEHYTELVDAGVPATISAVPRDSTRVWYRVFAGAVGGGSAADRYRDSLRSRGIIGAVRGVLANTPHAFLLGTYPDSVSGRREVQGLRESGIPAYIVSMPDGSVQVLFGAFESPNQAELADSVLPESGRSLSKVLVTRVGIAR